MHKKNIRLDVTHQDLISWYWIKNNFISLQMDITQHGNSYYFLVALALDVWKCAHSGFMIMIEWGLQFNGQFQ